MERMDFRIKGMCCATEIGVLKREVGPLVGGELNLAFDLLSGKMSVISSSGQVDPSAIMKAVAGTGMEALPWQAEAESRAGGYGESLWERHGRLFLCLLSGILTAAGVSVHGLQEGSWVRAFVEDMAAQGPPPWSRVLYAGAILAGGWMVFPRAYHSLRRMAPDMNLLMAVAVAGALAIGHWLEGASVAFLFALALYMESWSVSRARRAIRSLMDLSPEVARFVCPHDGDIEEKPVQDVPVGVIVLVRPGEKIPLDGEIIKGITNVNQASITGESMPLLREAGDEVYAGTLNLDGAIEFRSTRPSSDTALARIIHMVEEAQARRAPLEQLVERFARIYTPVMMGLACLIAVVPPLLWNGVWLDWFYQSLVILVIACPCSLVISTPVSIVAGLTSAARNGVLIKGGAYLEVPARIRAVAFDKTGTLTSGHPTVQRIIPLNGHSEADLLACAAALEAHSTHPLARAVLALARERGIAFSAAEDYAVLAGQGAQGTIDGRPYWIGSHRFIEQRGVEDERSHEIASGLEDAGHSVVMIWTVDHVCGLMSFADEVREAAPGVIRSLRGLGVEKVIVLTGDNKRTTEAVARAVGVDDYVAELLPEDKVGVIRSLQAVHEHVAMVGDGVNDAPAMAESTISIAMGAIGSDAAIETSDIALMSDDLTRLPWLIQHSRKTRRVIGQNIALSIGIKAVFIGMAFCEIATLWGAIAADMGASLLVIGNGLRLLKTGSD
ncbi:MAG: heavy metal translocating P-type ATPase [Syntrophobacteraceae bacterium]